MKVKALRNSIDAVAGEVYDVCREKETYYYFDEMRRAYRDDFVFMDGLEDMYNLSGPDAYLQQYFKYIEESKFEEACGLELYIKSTMREHATPSHYVAVPWVDKNGSVRESEEFVISTQGIIRVNGRGFFAEGHFMDFTPLMRRAFNIRQTLKHKNNTHKLVSAPITTSPNVDYYVQKILGFVPPVLAKGNAGESDLIIALRAACISMGIDA